MTDMEDTPRKTLLDRLDTRTAMGWARAMTVFGIPLITGAIIWAAGVLINSDRRLTVLEALQPVVQGAMGSRVVALEQAAAAASEALSRTSQSIVLMQQSQGAQEHRLETLERDRPPRQRGSLEAPLDVWHP